MLISGDPKQEKV